MVLGALLTLQLPVARADIVFSEVMPSQTDDGYKYVEVANTGPSSVDLGDWWICDQPSGAYVRLRETPTVAFQVPSTPGIVLAAGDFLVLRFLAPAGNYETQPNSVGTTTHFVDIGLTSTPPPFYLTLSAGNISIWDQTGAAQFPNFGVPSRMRDFVAWSETGVYIGIKRGCAASNAQAMLWPPPFAGNCDTNDPPPEFVAVDVAALVANASWSINYNGGSANDPGDYFLAPFTEGEMNVLPGDLNGNLVLDVSDAEAFVACLDQPADPPNCDLADLDGNGVVDCNDWRLFVDQWLLVSALPLPPFAPGDVNGDGGVNWDDNPAFFDVIAGFDTTPERVCAADMFANNILECNDLMVFFALLQEDPLGCMPGDTNGDGAVNGLDINLFAYFFVTLPCMSPSEFCVVDADNNFRVDQADIAAFVSRLLEP